MVVVSHNGQGTWLSVSKKDKKNVDLFLGGTLEETPLDRELQSRYLSKADPLLMKQIYDAITGNRP